MFKTNAITPCSCAARNGRRKRLVETSFHRCRSKTPLKHVKHGNTSNRPDEDPTELPSQILLWTLTVRWKYFSTMRASPLIKFEARSPSAWRLLVCSSWTLEMCVNKPQNSTSVSFFCLDHHTQWTKRIPFRSWRLQKTYMSIGVFSNGPIDLKFSCITIVC